MRRPYRLFEVVGLEIEYPTVDADLAAVSLVEPLFRELAGRPTSDVALDGAEFSNELADHVLEIKTSRPLASLAETERLLAGGVAVANALLRERFGAALLPTGMHPFFDPSTGRTWRRAGRRVYETYAALFDLRAHGWMNVQSCHVNLPFGVDETETAAMHNAAACLMPYLPALTASSPLVEGRPGPFICNRLDFYRRNQARFPLIAGDVIPEYMSGYEQYRRDVLRPIYRSIEGAPGAARLRHEWLNSRGEIVRFSRRAIEIRVLDAQECPKMDCACGAFIRAALRLLTDELRAGRWSLPDRAGLIEDFSATIAAGRAAPARSSHLAAWLGGPSRRATARDVLAALLERCRDRLASDERPYAELVAARIERGNLSERIRRAVGSGVSRRRVVEVYRELAACLDRNEPWRA